MPSSLHALSLHDTVGSLKEENCERQVKSYPQLDSRLLSLFNDYVTVCQFATAILASSIAHRYDCIDVFNKYGEIERVNSAVLATIYIFDDPIRRRVGLSRYSSQGRRVIRPDHRTIPAQRQTRYYNTNEILR